MRVPYAALVTSCFVLSVVLGACGQDDDREGARLLWKKIHAAPGFRSWERAPGYPTRKPSFTAHADAVDIWVNADLSGALSARRAGVLTEWPSGSIIVKEGYGGGSRTLVAVMEKRDGGWFWAEYDDEGEPQYSGRPSVCVDCHAHRRTYSDWVYAFELPR